MASAKTTTLTFRIEPDLKEALRAAAAREHRSIANMVEMMIRDYCDRNDVMAPSRRAKADDRPEPRARRAASAANDRRSRNNR